MHCNYMEVHTQKAEPWKVTLIDTGESTNTGGRLKRVRSYLDEAPFCLTYGDGLSDVDINALVDFHRSHGREATLTSVQPPGRFGVLDFDEDSLVMSFQEKPKGDGSWINGGFFVLNPSVIDRIEGDHVVWESDPLSSLSSDGQLAAFHHYGFWKPMDTLRDRIQLEELWKSNQAPWRVW